MYTILKLRVGLRHKRTTSTLTAGEIFGARITTLADESCGNGGTTTTTTTPITTTTITTI